MFEKKQIAAFLRWFQGAEIKSVPVLDLSSVGSTLRESVL